MIVSVRLAISTDDGIPVVLFGQEELLIQRAGDFELNVANAQEAAEAMLELAAVDLKRKTLALRGVDPSLSAPEDGPPPRPQGRRRRGR